MEILQSIIGQILDKFLVINKNLIGLLILVLVKNSIQVFFFILF
jgi:hypothetical protein